MGYQTPLSLCTLPSISFLNCVEHCMTCVVWLKVPFYYKRSSHPRRGKAMNDICCLNFHVIFGAMCSWRRWRAYLYVMLRANRCNIVCQKLPNCWMLNVSSVCTPWTWMLLCVVGSCCAKFETGQTLSYVQVNTKYPNHVGSCWPTMLHLFSHSAYPASSIW